MNQRRIGWTATAATLGVLALTASSVTAATVVRLDENGDGDWLFNRDASTSTPYRFTTDAASTGDGSLFVDPIGSSPSDKFIAEQFVDTTAGAFESVSYDFSVASGSATAYQQFYLNVYVEMPGGTANYYDCRYDFVPSAAEPAGFTTFTVDRTMVPTHVRAVNDGVGACTPTLDGLPGDAVIEVLALNVGDTTAGDAGVSGYLDNVVVAVGGETTIYDFEAPLTSPDQCKQGGWQQFGFTNQGRCVASLVASSHANK
jgi:hypothetical protein